jgi:hypothetical protein
VRHILSVSDALPSDVRMNEGRELVFCCTSSSPHIQIIYKMGAATRAFRETENRDCHVFYTGIGSNEVLTAQPNRDYCAE